MVAECIIVLGDHQLLVNSIRDLQFIGDTIYAHSYNYYCSLPFSSITHHCSSELEAEDIYRTLLTSWIAVEKCNRTNSYVHVLAPNHAIDYCGIKRITLKGCKITYFHNVRVENKPNEEHELNHFFATEREAREAFVSFSAALAKN